VNEVRLRPISPADEPFLLELYASTREDELAIAPWTPEQKSAFLEMQFDAQDRDYRGRHPDASFDVIDVGGKRAGRLLVHRGSEEFRVLDISLLPAWRGRGIGGELMLGLIAEAHAQGKPVRIHVERFNRARALYERLGFREVAEAGVYVLMECPPS
jgi:ribosomal protein S18 acetylase RimI-like enzyme